MVSFCEISFTPNNNWSMVRIQDHYERKGGELSLSASYSGGWIQTIEQVGNIDVSA